MTTTTNNTETNPTLNSLSNAAGQCWRILTAATRTTAKTVELTAATTATLIEASEVGLDIGIKALPTTPEEIKEGLKAIHADFTANTTNTLTTE